MRRLAVVLAVALAGCGALSWLAEPAWESAPSHVEAPCGPPPPPPSEQPAPPPPPSRGEVITSIGGIVTGNPVVWGLAGQLILALGSLARRKRAPKS